jgi:hypothetical protein
LQLFDLRTKLLAFLLHLEQLFEEVGRLSLLQPAGL